MGNLSPLIRKKFMKLSYANGRLVLDANNKEDYQLLSHIASEITSGKLTILMPDKGIFGWHQYDTPNASVDTPSTEDKPCRESPESPSPASPLPF